MTNNAEASSCRRVKAHAGHVLVRALIDARLVVHGLKLARLIRCRRPLLEWSVVGHTNSYEVAVRASSDLHEPREATRQGRETRGLRAHGLGQRRSGQEVDRVVLAQVDQRDPEQRRIRPTERARHRAHLGKQVSRHQ